MTDRQRAWLNFYFSDAAFLNASEAARLAGYKDPRESGHLNRTNKDIKAQIEARLAEIIVGKDEALSILSEHAQGDLGQFVDDEGAFDIAKARKAGKLKLVKKFKCRRVVRYERPDASTPEAIVKWAESGSPKEEAKVEDVTIDFELYDAQTAATTLLKAAGGLSDKTIISGDKENPLNINATVEAHHVFDQLSDAALIARAAQMFNRNAEEAASADASDDDLPGEP